MSKELLDWKGAAKLLDVSDRQCRRFVNEQGMPVHDRTSCTMRNRSYRPSPNTWWCCSCLSLHVRDVWRDAQPRSALHQLTAVEIEEVRARLDRGERHKEIALALGCSLSAVYRSAGRKAARQNTTAQTKFACSPAIRRFERTPGPSC